jgi:hypothetical protein
MEDIERIQEKLIKRNGAAKKEKKLSALDKYVIFSFACLLIFTVVVTVYQFKADMEFSPTLITCFYSCFGGELLLCAMIKRLKLKKEDNE